MVEFFVVVAVSAMVLWVLAIGLLLFLKKRWGWDQTLWPPRAPGAWIQSPRPSNTGPPDFAGEVDRHREIRTEHIVSEDAEPAPRHRTLLVRRIILEKKNEQETNDERVDSSTEDPQEADSFGA